MNISALARAVGLSRTAVLYYESIGLVRRARRSNANYRQYGEADLQLLRQICAYRAAGLTLEDIRGVIRQPASQFASILQKRSIGIAREIERLQEHQRAIGRLLTSRGAYRPGTVITKQKWVEIMRASGLSDRAMHSWHAEFERAAPDEHEAFLQFLRIPSEEIGAIRQWSRSLSLEESEN